MFGGARCTVCGRPPRRRFVRSYHGEVTCADHPVRCRCTFCSRPDPAVAPDGWRELCPGHHLCPTCGRDAVATQEDARRHLPSVRDQMVAIGVELAERVRVRVVDADEISAVPVSVGGGMLLGVTDSLVGPGGTTVTGIRVLAGLPFVHFGRTVAHEMGHAWLAQYARRRPERAVEEGVCELFAYAWLRRVGTPVGDAVRAALKANPDPVYGGGFRAVHAAVGVHGIERVLASLLERGVLP